MTITEITKAYEVLDTYLKQKTGKDETLHISSLEAYQPKDQDTVFIDIDFFFADRGLDYLELRTKDKISFEIWDFDSEDKMQDDDLVPPKIKVF